MAIPCLRMAPKLTRITLNITSGNLNRVVFQCKLCIALFLMSILGTSTRLMLDVFLLVLVTPLIVYTLMCPPLKCIAAR